MSFYLKTKRSYISLGELGSSVSIVSGYRLDNWTIEVQSPAEAKVLFL
jgi:hypothetical protein